MTLLCRLWRHAATPSEIWNAGLFFSRCRRCGHDMVRRPEQAWKPVPRGQHVVWRRATERNVAVILPKSPGRENLHNLMDDMGLFAMAGAYPVLESRRSLEG